MKTSALAALALALFFAASPPAGEASRQAPAAEVPAGETVLPENRWTKVADAPADPLGRELDPGRGAFWCFEPAAGVFLRFGGYTPTECNALWSFDLAARRWENPLPVDYAWPPPADRPGAGSWWSMAWDGKRRVIWMSGGVGIASRKRPELFNDIWQYDPATKSFTAMKSKGLPSWSEGCRIVYDSKNDLVIRAPGYAGEGSAKHNRDTTWVYDPNKNFWEGRRTPGSPNRGWTGLCVPFVFDAAAGKSVYLEQGQDHLVATWTYDAAANAWAKLQTKERPPARVVAGAAYDAANRLVVVCGGGGHPGKGDGYLARGRGVRLTDTWALDTAKAEWRKLDVGAPAVPRLPGEEGLRFEHFTAMDYDAKNGALVLSAPTVGVWALRVRPDGAAALPALELAALPPARQTEPPKEPTFKMAPPNQKLLKLPANTWTQLDGGPSIGGGEVPLIYDEATGFCLKYGGCNNGGAGSFSGGYGNDLSAYDPATERWIALRWVDPCGPPRPRNGCTRSYCHDPVRKFNWFAGPDSPRGNTLAGSCPPGFVGEGTWRYDGLRDRFDMVPSRGKSRGWDRVICCYDRASNLFVFNGWLFDPATGTWSEGGSANGLPVNSYTYGCYVDSLKGLFLVRPDKTPDGGWSYKAVLFSAAEKAWKALPAAGAGLPADKHKHRPITAYDPDADAVICLLAGRTFAYDVRAGAWKAPDVKAPPKVGEQMTFDRRHKVALATGPMGAHVWAFRYGGAGR